MRVRRYLFWRHVVLLPDLLVGKYLIGWEELFRLNNNE